MFAPSTDNLQLLVNSQGEPMDHQLIDTALIILQGDGKRYEVVSHLTCGDVGSEQAHTICSLAQDILLGRAKHPSRAF